MLRGTFAWPDDSYHVPWKFDRDQSRNVEPESNERRVRNPTEASRACYQVVAVGAESIQRPEFEDCFLQLKAQLTKLTAEC